MSTFGIFAETIESVSAHPNADRLELAKLIGIGYQFIIGKGQFQPGDQVLYFPIDALITPEILATIGLTGKLSGKNKNRVKTIRLRGCISQGIVVAPATILKEQVGPTFGYDSNGDGTYRKIDYAELLGVTKYEPEEAGPGQLGPQSPLPAGVCHYDIENCERWQNQLGALMDQPVVITEKLEGSHIAITRLLDGTIVTCTRKTSLVEPESKYHMGAENSGIYGAIKELAEIHPEHQITIRGELCGPGVQGNIYGMTRLHMYVFDIELSGRPIDAKQFRELTIKLAIPTVPFLSTPGTTLREWLGSRSIQEASNGQPVLGSDTNVLREGIVIKPETEQTDCQLGRLFLKQRSPDYLASSDS